MTKSSQQKIRIKIFSFDYKVVDESARTIIDAVERTGAYAAGPIPLPTNIKKITVNRSTFVSKDARLQYEIRTHKRLIDVADANPDTVQSLSNLSIPSGVDVQIKMI